MLADMLTPVAVYRKLRDHFPCALLLESADYHDRSDSKSFICLDPIAGFEAKGNKYSIQLPGADDQSFEASGANVFKALTDFVNAFESNDTDLPFQLAGVFGYSSYEAVQYMEDIQLSNMASSTKNNPDLKYQLFRFILVFDHFNNQLYIAKNQFIDHEKHDQDLHYIFDLLRLQNTPDFGFCEVGLESCESTDEEFLSRVARGIKHCERGDVFQIVISREFSQEFNGDDFNVYRALRSINPSPYLFYFDYGNFKIFGSSPEAQLQVDQQQATIHPIAGTVVRGQDRAEDQRLAKRLSDDPKERAEHVMLVDLARNDLSKHATDVQVETYAEIQYFSHVIHMVSKVKGQVNPDASGLHIYGDTFPAGTLSGAPKYRAMQLIDEIESVTRNFYGGAIGFFGFDGQVNHAIIIRSVLSKNNQLVYQAGGGVVAHSTPAGELDEVNNKIAAIRKSIKMAAQL